MIKSIYLIIFALFGHLTTLNAMEDEPNPQITNETHLRAETPNKDDLNEIDLNEIDKDYDLIDDRNFIPPDPVGIINFGTIIRGAFSAYHQYGTKKMVNYNFAYDKVCAKVVKDLITDKRYLVNHLKISHANLFKLYLGSMAISYLVLINLCNVPAIYFNAMLETIDASFPYSNAPSFFDKYHMVHECNTKILSNLAFLFGCLSVYLYYNLPTYINNTLDRIIIEENVCDVKSQFDPVTINYLCHSIDRKACKNPLIFAMYPDALRLRNEYNKKKIKPQDIFKATGAGKYNFWRLMKKIKENRKLSDIEQANYNAVIGFPLFRYEYGLTRLWEEPMNLPIILRKLLGFRYIFDKDEKQMNVDITNIDKVIQMIASKVDTYYFENHIFNQDIKIQNTIASLASNSNLKNELLLLDLKSADGNAPNDIENAKLFLVQLLQEDFVLEKDISIS